MGFLAMAWLCCCAFAQASGLNSRVPNQTLQMPSTLPVLGFTTTNAFPGLELNTPFAVATPPGETNRLFIIEKAGRIVVVTNLADPHPTRTVFMDITDRVLSDGNEEGLLGLAFHPGYVTNRSFYVFYTCLSTSTNRDSTVNDGLHDRLSAFKASSTDPTVGDPSSELVLINQYDENNAHNAGDLHFGPDDYLYVSLGDEGAGFDSYNNSQLIDYDFFSGVLRIDVDKRPGNLIPNRHAASSTNYFVPIDNPFVGATNFNGLTVESNNVRSEFWCVGLRNPWRFTFNPLNGDLLVADVGQENWEELNLVTKGGNYGWAYREGNYDGPKADIAPENFVSLSPLLSYTHGTESYMGDCIIGGVVCTNPQLPQINGAYVFGDYIAANLWMLRYNGTNVTQWQRIGYETFPTSFGVDPSSGDVLIVKHTENIIKRLIYVTNAVGPQLPQTLDQTGAFSELTNLTPNPGLVPYTVNAPFWSDGAIKTRWFCVPDTNATIGFNADGNWQFPSGMVWVKHFDLALTNGDPTSLRRIETRFLVKNSNNVYGVTYRWDSATNATLVPDDGFNEDIVINDGATTRTQTWHYPARNECVICHTSAGGLALGFNTAQLNRDFNYNGTVENQLRALSDSGYFSSSVANINTLRALVDPNDPTVSLDYRVHSYLTANCVQCHQPNGPASTLWDASLTTPISQAGLINGDLVNNFWIDGNRVIAPGSLEFSILLKRISTLDVIRMPPVASRLINSSASNMLASWIMSLTNYQSFPDWQLANFGSTNCPTCGSDNDFDADGSGNYLEYLTATDPLNPTNFWSISATRGSNSIQIIYPQLANRSFQVDFTTNLIAPSWQPLDVPDNRPFFSATNRTAIVNGPVGNTPRFYRVQVSEP